MTNQATTLSVFDGDRLAVSDEPQAVFDYLQQNYTEPDRLNLLIFEDGSGRQTDFDLRGATPPPAANAPQAPAQGRGKGRPKLGVVSREVTLLPRHWEWLASQPGGASAALRRLVDKARGDSGSDDVVRAAQTRCYTAISALAGNLPGFEEAVRSLYARDLAAFEHNCQQWPEDIRSYALRLSSGAFPAE